MEVRTILILSFLSIVLSCNRRYIENSDGIVVENISELLDGTAFTSDNKIYRGGLEFIYDYTFIKDGENYFFKSLNDFSNLRDAWVLVPQEMADSITITQIKMLVLKDQGRFFGKDLDYKESVVEYHYLTPLGLPYFKDLTKIGEQTGLIENKKNIWIHPPRGFLFKIMELNPWPYIQYPIKRSSTWSWDLEIGDKWGDDRWKTWNGNIVNQVEYKIGEEKIISTAWGDIDCLQIISTAKSSIGNTKLIAYFNEGFGGFVKLIYTNIDGSIIEMNLKEMKNE